MRGSQTCGRAATATSRQYAVHAQPGQPGQRRNQTNRGSCGVCWFLCLTDDGNPLRSDSPAVCRRSVTYFSPSFRLMMSVMCKYISCHPSAGASSPRNSVIYFNQGVVPVEASQSEYAVSPSSRLIETKRFVWAEAPARRWVPSARPSVGPDVRIKSPLIMIVVKRRNENPRSFSSTLARDVSAAIKAAIRQCASRFLEGRRHTHALFQ